MVWLGRKLVQVHCGGLANLLLGDREVMPELIQENATVENITKALVPIISGVAADSQRREFKALRALLGERNPAEEVAKVVLQMIEERSLNHL